MQTAGDENPLDHLLEDTVKFVEGTLRSARPRRAAFRDAGGQIQVSFDPWRRPKNPLQAFIHRSSTNQGATPAWMRVPESPPLAFG